LRAAIGKNAKIVCREIRKNDKGEWESCIAIQIPRKELETEPAYQQALEIQSDFKSFEEYAKKFREEVAEEYLKGQKPRFNKNSKIKTKNGCKSIKRE
jgi:hypothetical protein